MKATEMHYRNTSYKVACGAEKHFHPKNWLTTHRGVTCATCLTWLKERKLIELNEIEGSIQATQGVPLPEAGL